MSFDMAGSLTSTPSVSNALHNHPPTAQSTPVLSSLRLHAGNSSSLLTTPTLSTPNNHDISAHSTPKATRMSPIREQNPRSEAPRTPTPFKRALAEVYRGREPLSNTPQTPTKRVEDITEIIKKDMQQDFTDLDFTHSGDLQVQLICIIMNSSVT